jgi:Fe-S-cluster containining protein
MGDASHDGDGTVRAEFALRTNAGQVAMEVDVPAGPTSVDRLLPLAQAMADGLVELAVHEVEAERRTITCRAGCGACCRQLVPLAEAEARHLRALVDALPEPRRSEVRRRFAEALRQFDNAGLLATLRQVEALDRAGRRRLGLDYFLRRIPCPFLEDESCSIHPNRPIACREYLVTSPAEYCANPRDNIEGVSFPTHVWTALARLDPPGPGAGSIRWVPLILALEWAESHPEEPPARPGPDLLRELIDHVVHGTGIEEDADPRPQ